MIRKIAMAMVVTCWAAVVFLMGLHFTFPSDTAAKRLQWEVETRSDGRYSVLADSVSLWRLTGLEMTNARLLTSSRGDNRRGKQGQDEEEASAALVLAMQTVAARLEILPLLSGTRAAAFKGRLYGGDMDGRLAYGTDEVDLALRLSDVDLSLYPMDSNSFTLDLAGFLKADMALVLDMDDATDSTGTGWLECRDLVLKSGKILGFSLPENATFSKFRLEYEISDGKARITRAKVAGDMFDADIEGEISLNKKLSRSRPRISVSFTLDGALADMAKLAPGLRGSRDQDGVFRFLLTGTLDHPRFKPDRARLSRRRSSSGISRISPTTDGDTSMDDDERQRLREERIRKRRERLEERRAAREQAGEGEPSLPNRLARKSMDDLEPPVDEYDPGQEYDEPYEDDPSAGYDDDLGQEPEFDDVDIQQYDDAEF